MEGYNNSSERGHLPAYLTPALDMNSLIHLQSAHPDYLHHHHHHHCHQASAVKREGGGSSLDHANLAMGGLLSNKEITTSKNSSEMEGIKAKMIAHPQYSNLLEAYMDCQKVGAPPEIAARLSTLRQDYENRERCSSVGASKDSELDQFMEAYCDMLVKYKEELTRPVQEAMEFMHRIESQLSLLSNSGARIVTSDEIRSEGMGQSSEEEQETEVGRDGREEEERELKKHLLKKYSGYLSSLKQELSKKKKKGKLPKEARSKLLSWWELHYKWPYPSESEKVALAEATELDQKQINNWFINQRKRHWKPSEDMQFMVMDGLHHPHNHINAAAAAFYMGDAPYRFGT